MEPSAKTLLGQLIDAIEHNRTEDRTGFYPEKVFEALEPGWLARAKRAVDWSPACKGLPEAEDKD